MKFHVVLSVLMAAMLSFASCQKAADFEPSTTIPDPVDTLPSTPIATRPDNIITASFIGRILDENGDPMKGAEVSAGGRKVTSDEYGIFRIKDALVSEKSSFIVAKKAGYLAGSRTVISQAGGTSFIQIKMIRKILKGSFHSSNGMVLNIHQMAGVTFPSNAIVNDKGESYNGKVLVYGTAYDPTSSDFIDIMPGDLRGITADSQATALKSYGMLNVQLESESGQVLQVAKGKMARISMTVPGDLLANAPAEIPLWHFSEVDGKWREEGKAFLKNGTYEGEVSHFSTWNYDVPYNFVVVKIRIVALKGFPVAYQTLKITDESTNNYNVAKSDSLGYVIMPVPKNANLRAEVLNDCGLVLGSQEYTPLTEDTDLGILRFKEESATYVEGKVLSCSGVFLDPGFVTLFADGLYYATEIWDGIYQLPLNSCWKRLSKATIFAYDAAGMNNSGTVELTIDGTNTKAPDLTICGNKMDEFLRFQFDNDEPVLITTPPDSSAFSRFSYMQTKIEFFKNSNFYGEGISLYFVLNDTVPQVTDHNSLMMWYNGIELIGATSNSTSTLHFDVKEFGKPGEYVHFTFSGQLTRYPTYLESHTITGECRIKRIKDPRTGL